MLRRSLLLGLIASAAALWAAGPAAAQTNGSYQATASGNWSSAANWSGGIPDAGGVATLSDAFGQTAALTVTIDTTSRTLSQIVYNGGYSYAVATSGGGSIIMPAAGGLTLNSINSLVSSPAVLFTTTNTISAPITGTGPLIKTGIGQTALTGANTFTGAVQINQGQLWVNGGDGSLGNAANAVTLDGGIMGVNVATLTSNRTFNIGAGGGTFRTFTALTVNGGLNGSGTLIKQIGNAGMTLAGDSSTGANTFTGAIRVDNGTFTLSGAGRVAAGGGVEVNSTLTLDNAGTNANNRLAGRAVVSRGAAINYTGNAGAGSTESLGGLTLPQGNTTLTVTPNAAQPATLTFASLARQNNSTLFVRGTGLGQAPAANVGNVVFTASPGTLIGGGTDPLTTPTASVLPFAYANTSAAATAGSVHVTWDATSGRLVPLDATNGYVTDLTTATALQNVTSDADAVLGAATTVNALRLTPTANRLISGADLTVTSGNVLYTPATSTLSTTISAGLTAGANELVLASTTGSAGGNGGLIVSGVISGTGGLTRTGGGVVFLTGANTYTGPTSFHGGTTVTGSGTATATGSAPGPLGQGTGPIVLAGSGANTVRLWTTGNLVIDRPVQALTGQSGVVGLGTVGLSTNESVTVNGNVTVTAANPASESPFNAFLYLEGGDARANAVTVNGVISGTGGLRGTFGGYSILNNTNTYSGGTVIGTTGFLTGTGTAAQAVGETWEVGADNAFGTGTLWWHSTAQTTQPLQSMATVVSAGAGTRTLSNPVVLASGLARVTGTAPLTLSGPVDLNGGAANATYFEVGATSPVTITGVVSKGGLVKSGPGTLTLSGTNVYAGQTFIRQGVLSVATIGNGLTAGNLGAAPATASYITLSGGSAAGETGTLRYTGPGETTNRLFALAGTGGVLDASGTGPLVFSNTGTVTQNTPVGSGAITGVTLVANAGAIALTTPFNAQFVVGSTVSGNANIPAGTTITEVGPNYIRLSNPTTNTSTATSQSITLTFPASVTGRTLTLTGTNTGLNTLASTLGVGVTGLPLSVAKTGPGTWALTGNNAYTGGTTVSQGTLLVNGQTGTNSGTGAGAVTVNSGGTFGGTGRAAGAVTVNSGGTLAPGALNGNTGTLSVGAAVTLNAGSTFRVGIAPGAVTAAANSGGSATPGTGNSYINAGTNTYVFNTPNVLVDVTGASFTDGSSYSFQVGQGSSVTAGAGATPVTVGTFTFVSNGTDVTALYSGGGGPSLTFDPGLNNVYLNFTPVPEPATVLAVAGLGLAAVRLRRRLVG